MNITRTLLATFIIILLTSFISESKSQSQVFEGIVVYNTTVVPSENNDIPAEQFKIMFKNMSNVSNLYLKGNNYKLVGIDPKTNKPGEVALGSSETGMVFNFTSGQNDVGVVKDLKKMNLPEPVITRNNDEPLTIMGKKCYSVTIEYENISKTTIYFSDDYKIDTETYKNNPIGFFDYLYRTGAIPLKIYSTEGDSVYTIVYTAVDINEKSIDDKVFELPGFKRVFEAN